MRHARSIGAVAGVLAGAVMLAACTGQEDPGSEPETTGGPEASDEEPEPRAEELWSVEAELVGEPAAAEGAVVSYLRQDGALAVAAWDAETGEELWRDSAHPGFGAPGIAVDVAVGEVGGEQRVTYLSGVHPETYLHTLVIADLETGRAAASTGDLQAVSRPEACDDGEGACLTARAAGEERTRPYRLDLDGTARLDEGSGLSDGARALGPNVFDSGDRPPRGEEMLGYADGGGERWRRPYEEVFEGEGFSSDWGWSWREHEESGLLIGTSQSNDRELIDAEEDHVVDEVVMRATVALDPVDGRTVWRLEGAGGCGFDITGLAQVVTLCRWNAGETERVFGEEGLAGMDTVPVVEADVDLVGVEAETGEVLWEVPFDLDEAGAGDRSFEQVPGELVVSSQGRTVVVDPEDGRAEEPGPERLFLCREGRDPLEQVAGAEEASYHAGLDLMACDQGREPVETADFPARLVEGLPETGGVAVLATSTGLRAYDLTSAQD